MKKIVMAGALAAAVTVGLVAAPKAEASSAKYTIKQYRTVKKYKHGMKATFSYQLPQLKGSSAAVKKINKDIKKSLVAEKKNAKQLFNYAKDGANNGFKNLSYYDATTAKITYNKNGVISFRYDQALNDGSGTFLIGSWTYSLKTGKKLTVFDVAEGDKSSVCAQLYYGAVDLGADDEYLLRTTHASKMNYTLKGGKVYVYPRIAAAYNSKYFVIPSRYK